MKKVLFILLTISTLFVQAQLSKDIFPLNREFRSDGFIISPQLTYSLPIGKSGNANDFSNYNYDVKLNGKFAYGLGLGWFHSFKKLSFPHWVEGVVSYRVFKGKSEHSGILTAPPMTFESEDEFETSLLNASFRIVHTKTLGKFTFLSFGAGVNANYLISQEEKQTNTHPTFVGTKNEDFQGQFNIQIGVGFRLTETVLMIPSIETPLANIFPNNRIEPYFSYLGADFQPIVFSLKFMILRKDPVMCNAPVFEGLPQ